MNKSNFIESHASIVVNAPVNQVWSALTNIDEWPENFSHVSAILFNEGIKENGSFVWKSKGLKITSRITKLAPMTELEWEGRALGTFAAHKWTLSPHAQGVLLETHETMQGWMVGILQRTMQKMLNKTLQTWLSEIKELSEKVV